MGVIRERMSEIARRCGDLAPLAPQIRQVLVDGNRERALAGTDGEGRAFAPLAPSTLRERKGDGPPLAPQGASSSIVRGYVVSVLASVGRLSITGAWPGLSWLKYHVTGTRKMPKRDPTEFRPRDLDRIRALLKEHVMRK